MRFVGCTPIQLPATVPPQRAANPLTQPSRSLVPPISAGDLPAIAGLEQSHPLVVSAVVAQPSRLPSDPLRVPAARTQGRQLARGDARRGSSIIQRRTSSLQLAGDLFKRCVPSPPRSLPSFTLYLDLTSLVLRRDPDMADQKDPSALRRQRSFKDRVRPHVERASTSIARTLSSRTPTRRRRRSLPASSDPSPEVCPAPACTSSLEIRSGRVRDGSDFLSRPASTILQRSLHYEECLNHIRYRSIFPVPAPTTATED